MPKKLRTNPRKSAVQERSRATVDALLEATARILVKEGYDHASTNKIAQLAGVSIGSLYQYFPSKEALVGAVIDRHSEDMMRLARDAIAKIAGRPIEEGVPEIVRVMIEAHRVNPKLHRVLVEQVPRVGRLDNIQDFDRQATTKVRAYLEAHRRELGVRDIDMAAFIVVTAVEAVTHAAIVYPTETVTDEKANRLVNEVTTLVLRYLKAPDTARRRAS